MEYLYFINNRILSLANNLDVPFNCFCMSDLRINLYSQCYWSILTKLSWSFLLVIYFLSWREYKVLSVSFWSYISCITCHKQWSCSGLFPELFGDVNSLFSFFFSSFFSLYCEIILYFDIVFLIASGTSLSRSDVTMLTEKCVHYLVKQPEVYFIFLVDVYMLLNLLIFL